MEDLSGSYADHLIPKKKAGESFGFAFGVALIAGFAVLGPIDAGAEPPDWFGSWHVLVHYEDTTASDAERERWDDRAWVFERQGDLLRWTEYPTVVFSDETGRFSDDEANRVSRVGQPWEPDVEQLADIKDGLAVSDRGVASVTLRRSEQSWVSTPEQAISSASMIRYLESWRVDSGAEGPIFKREDALRSERAEELAGVTIYTTRAVEDEGRLLRGDFERDGTQRGTFIMTRAAGVHGHGD